MSPTENIPPCPLTAAFSVLGGKWKLFVLHYLLHHDTLRFSQLHRLIPQATQKMLTQQLRELEEAGIVSRQVYAEVPPRVEYRLTPHGQTLRPLLDGLYGWGTLHRTHLGATDEACVRPAEVPKQLSKSNRHLAAIT